MKTPESNGTGVALAAIPAAIALAIFHAKSGDNIPIPDPMESFTLYQETVGALYLLCHGFVLNLAHRFGESPEDAENTLQEVGLRLMKYIADFRSDSAFTTWLFKITRNVIMEKWRRQDARNLVYCLDQEAGKPENGYCTTWGDLVPDTEDVPEQTSNHILTQQLMACLKGEDALLLYLHDMQGMEVEEIGRELRIKRGAVKSRLFRARQRCYAFYNASKPRFNH